MIDSAQLAQILTDGLNAVAEERQKATYVAPSKNSRAYACDHGDCDRPAYAGGLCNTHYIRRRNGSDMDKPIRSRSLGKCTECAKPTGSKGGWGYCASHYKRARFQTIKKLLIEALGGQCSACETQFPTAVYDFHHVGEKSDSPSYLLNNSGIKEISDEISKCVLLCANCHRIEHHGDDQ